jgi:tetratricopeptide (TPR) repeat protein
MTDAVDPRIAEAFQRLREGRADEAARLCQAAVAAGGGAPAQAALARALLAAGRPDAAGAALSAALAIDPDDRLALLEDANLARREGDAARAERNLRRLAALHPDDPLFAALLARELLAGGRLAEAGVEARRALALDPSRIESQMVAAELAHAGGDFEDARRRFAALVARQAGLPRAWLGLARAAERLGDLRAAGEAFGRALALDDRDPEALRGFARIALTMGDRHGVLRASRRLLEVQPGSADAWYGMAVAHWQEHDIPAVRAALREVLVRQPGHVPARWGMACLPEDVVPADAAAAEGFAVRLAQELVAFESLPVGEPRHAAAIKAALTLTTCFYVHYAREDALPLQRRMGALLRRQARAIDGDAPAAPRPARDRPRVLFVSAFFHEHSVSKLFERVLTGLDRTRLEVRCLHAEHRRDPVVERLAAAVDGFRAGIRAPDALRAAILAEAPDVLVHLDVGMDAPLQWLAAQRLAPVQVALWGHPITTGLGSIDWFLTADAMEREGGEADYSERVFRLPGLGCRFAPPGSAAPDATFVPPALAADGVRFGLMQAAFKVTPVHDALLARIAGALPGAAFELTPGPVGPARERLAARTDGALRAAGLEPAGRLRAHPRLSRGQWLALAASLDVNLDPIGWSGGVTSLEMFWFDIPTVTLPGRSMRSRHTFGMLRLMELDDRLVARDLEDYVRIAVELGRSADLRAELRGLIAERKHRLYDDPRVSQALEGFLLDVAAGRGPRPAAP